MALIVPPHVLAACSHLQNNGFQAYLVGGAVRDSLLNLKPLDWDIATDALPEQVEEIFRSTIPTGKKFGTITVLIDGQGLEVTTLRQDGPYTDQRRPDQVFFTDKLEKDLSRRDFTINAIAYNPFSKLIIDPFRGKRHLKRKLLTTVGEPSLRFQEDPLRMLRLLRFQAVLGFRVAKKTRLAIQPSLITTVSAERIQNELNKMLVGSNLAPALLLLHNSGLLNKIIPELATCAGRSAGKSHPFDLLQHSMMAAHFAKPELALRWAALLHDIGKLHSLRREHAEIGAKMARTILTRLKCSNKLIAQVETLVANHMFTVNPHSPHKAFRKFVAGVGEDTAYQLIKLRQADLAGLNKDPRLIINYGKMMNERVDLIIAEQSALTIKDLAVDGNVLLERLDLSPGPIVGEILAHLLEQVLQEPKLNRREKLIVLAQTYLKQKQEKH